MNENNQNRFEQSKGQIARAGAENEANIAPRINDGIKNINLEKQPERDLWRGIEQALQNSDNAAGNSKLSGMKPMLAMAASFMVVAVISWASFESGKSMQGDALVAAMSEQHSSQKKSLLISFKDQPAATSNWQQQIDELDEAAQAIKRALKEEPNNSALLRMLKNVYEQQMAIIERVHEPSWARI
ncbi:MAG: hypothetical protein ACI97K_002811 [Glaciecola sp.]|jgi:hypothetical protein